MNVILDAVILNAVILDAVILNAVIVKDAPLLFFPFVISENKRDMILAMFLYTVKMMMKKNPLGLDNILLNHLKMVLTSQIPVSVIAIRQFFYSQVHDRYYMIPDRKGYHWIVLNQNSFSLFSQFCGQLFLCTHIFLSYFYQHV